MSDEETPTQRDPAESDAVASDPAESPAAPAGAATEPVTEPEPEPVPEPAPVVEPEPEATLGSPVTVPPAPGAMPPLVTPTPSPSKRRGVFVPAWAAAIVVLLVVAAVGFGVGRWTADDSSSTASADNGGVITPAPGGNGNTPNLPSISRAFLGVATENAANGVEIVSVGDNTPADGAGLQEGDIITAVDDNEVSSPAELLEAIQEHDPGDEVTIHYTRDGEDETAEVELGTRNQGNPN